MFNKSRGVKFLQKYHEIYGEASFLSICPELPVIFLENTRNLREFRRRIVFRNGENIDFDICSTQLYSSVLSNLFNSIVFLSSIKSSVAFGHLGIQFTCPFGASVQFNSIVITQNDIDFNQFNQINCDIWFTFPVGVPCHSIQFNIK